MKLAYAMVFAAWATIALSPSVAAQQMETRVKKSLRDASGRAWTLYETGSLSVNGEKDNWTNKADFAFDKENRLVMLDGGGELSRSKKPFGNGGHDVMGVGVTKFLVDANGSVWALQRNGALRVNGEKGNWTNKADFAFDKENRLVMLDRGGELSRSKKPFGNAGHDKLGLGVTKFDIGADGEVRVLTLTTRLNDYWSALLKVQSSTGPRGLDYEYPTEPAMEFVSAYITTTDPKLKAQYEIAALKQLEFAQTQSKWCPLREIDWLLTTDPVGGKRRALIDPTGRHIYNLLLAGRLLDPDGASRAKLRAAADQVADAVVTKLWRLSLGKPDPKTCQTLLAAGYTKGPGGYSFNIKELIVDLNQHASLGLAFTLLYFEPKSRYHQNPEARVIALNHLHAGLQAQVIAKGPDFGKLPLHDRNDRVKQYDTMYAGQTIRHFLLASRFWKDHLDASGLKDDRNINEALANAARWLSTKERLALKTSSERFYWQGCQKLDCHMVAPAGYGEIWGRLGLYYKTGALNPDQCREWAQRAYAFLPVATQDPVKHMSFTEFCYLNAMGVPANIYLPP